MFIPKSHELFNFLIGAISRVEPDIHPLGAQTEAVLLGEHIEREMLTDDERERLRRYCEEARSWEGNWPKRAADIELLLTQLGVLELFDWDTYERRYEAAAHPAQTEAARQIWLLDVLSLEKLFDLYSSPDEDEVHP